MSELPQQLANGLILGAMYGLIAIGYTMVYGIVQLINFAHGEIFMVGGFGALSVFLALPAGTSLALALPIMLLGGIAVSVLVGIAAERFAYRPLRGAPASPPSSPPSACPSRSSRPSGSGTPTANRPGSSPSSRATPSTSSVPPSSAATSSSSSPHPPA